MGGSQGKIDSQLEQLPNSPKLEEDAVHIDVKQKTQKIEHHTDHSKMILGKKRNNDSHNMKSLDKSQNHSFYSVDQSKKSVRSPDYSNLEDSLTHHNKYSYYEELRESGRAKAPKSRRQELFISSNPRSINEIRLDSEKIVVEESPSPTMAKVNIFKKAAAKNKLAKQNELKADLKLNTKAIVIEASKQFETQRSDPVKPRDSKRSDASLIANSFITKNDQNYYDQKKIEGLCKDVIGSNTNDEELNLRIQKIMEKHAFIKYWHRGPNLDQKNQNLFVKDDKVIIIDEDEQHKDQTVNRKNPDDVLGELIQQNINPIQFIIGDKLKIWEQMKAEEERVTKERKEQETKRLIKKSDVRMTIYPAFDNFFQSNYKQQ